MGSSHSRASTPPSKASERRSREPQPGRSAIRLTHPTTAPRGDLTFGPPLAKFGKLWGIGLNYAEHAGNLDEQLPDEPASFMKPNTALAGPGGPIRLPPTEQSERVTAEVELGIVMGQTYRKIYK